MNIGSPGMPVSKYTSVSIYRYRYFGIVFNFQFSLDNVEAVPHDGET